MGFDRRIVFGSVPAAAVAGGLVTVLVLGGARSAPVSAQTTAQMTADQRNTAESLEGAFMKVSDTVGPATVYIRTKMDTPTTSRGGGNGPMILPFGDDSPFGDLFGPGSPFGNRRGGSGASPSLPRVVQSSGSGVIVRPDGYVLTNDHVVEGARNDEVSVTMADGTVYDHCKVYRDYRSDLAVVKINAKKPLPYVSFADSSKLHVGQWAVAIGAPYGEQNSMTAGIVSALNRKTAIGSGSDVRYYPSLIQTDASINPGNSGGPLLNIDGQLIGVNVAIESPSGTSAGIGFAIPSNSAKAIMEQLITKGTVTRAELGIAPEDIPVGLRAALGTDQGAYVRQVMGGTPADKAGIQPGDVITHIGDKPVTSEVTLRDTVASTMPNTTVPITLLRDGKTLTVNARLDELDKKVAAAAPSAPSRRPASDLGIDARTLTPDIVNASQVPFPTSSKGVLVAAVAPGSAASDGDLSQGDVITAVNGAPVTAAAALNAVIAKAKSGDVLTFTVLRYDQSRSVWDRAVANVTVP